MRSQFVIPVIVGIVAMIVLSVLPAMAAPQGVIKDLHPPMNDGTHHGVGMIIGDDGKKYVFQTPSDNDGIVLTTGDVVTFDVTNERHVTNVALSLSCTPETCLPPLPP